MKKCQNCDTLNEAEAVWCRHCRMKGNFKPEILNDLKPLPNEQSGERCANCDHETNGLSNCPVCRIPINKKFQIGSVHMNTAMPSQAPATYTRSIKFN